MPYSTLTRWVREGAGPEATIAPEMLAFAAAYGVTFRPHRVGDPNRKARIERPFRYIEGNEIVTAFPMHKSFAGLPTGGWRPSTLPATAPSR